MALAPSVHIATHFGQAISCSWKKLSITLKISELFFTSRQLLTEYKFLLHLILVDKSQKKLKAERRLTHQWIHLIVVQNNLPSGVLRLVVPALGCFSVFLRTHPSQTLFCTYH